MVPEERRTVVVAVAPCVQAVPDTPIDAINYRARMLTYITKLVRGYMLVHRPPASEVPALERWLSSLEAEALLHRSLATDTRQFEPDEC